MGKSFGGTYALVMRICTYFALILFDNIFAIWQDKWLNSQNVLESDAILAPDWLLWQKTETKDDMFLSSFWQIYDNLSNYVAGINLYLLDEQLTMPNLS